MLYCLAFELKHQFYLSKKTNTHISTEFQPTLYVSLLIYEIWFLTIPKLIWDYLEFKISFTNLCSRLMQHSDWFLHICWIYSFRILNLKINVAYGNTTMNWSFKINRTVSNNLSWLLFNHKNHNFPKPIAYKGPFHTKFYSQYSREETLFT